MLGKYAVHLRTWLLLLIFCCTGNAKGQNISGYWQGILHQPSGGASIYYPYSLTIQQAPNGTVTGTSLLLDPTSTSYAQHRVSGSFQNGVLNYQTQIIAEIKPPGRWWCSPGVNLTYNPAAESLTGPWNQLACSSGTIEVWRLKILSGATFCEGAVGQVVVSGKNVRWYSDSSRTNLVATGNSFLPNINTTTTFYVTQTYYNIESPTLPLLITIKPKKRVTVNKTICNGESYHGYLNSGTYSDTLAGSDGCDSIRTLDLTVLEQECDVVFPTAISPNNDGRNEQFKMLKTSNVKNMHLTIYNRWGLKVYESFDVNAGWDGRFKGVQQGAGVYVWFCTYTKNNSNVKQRGTFVLLR